MLQHSAAILGAANGYRPLALETRTTAMTGGSATLWRRDAYGNALCYSDYGNRNSQYGWEIDHYPVPAALVERTICPTYAPCTAPPTPRPRWRALRPYQSLALGAKSSRKAGAVTGTVCATRQYLSGPDYSGVVEGNAYQPPSVWYVCKSSSVIRGRSIPARYWIAARPQSGDRTFTNAVRMLSSLRTSATAQSEPGRCASQSRLSVRGSLTPPPQI